MPDFQPFITRFQARTGLKLVEARRIRDNYREYYATSNEFTLFRVGVQFDETDGATIGMVTQPDMYELDPESSASYRRTKQ